MSETINCQMQMDACRPGSDDLFQGELKDAAKRVRGSAADAESFRRSQNWDKAIGEIVRDGEVPDGLASALLESVRANKQEAVSRDVELNLVTQRRQRRYVVWGAGLLSLATVIGLVVLGSWRSVPDRRLTRSQLLASVERWIVKPGMEWQLLTEQEVGQFSLDTRINFHPDRWQAISLGAGNDAVVYSDEFARRESLYLFVIEIGTDEVMNLPSYPPRTADWNSQGWYVGVWQRDRRVYALAVKGNGEREYKRLLRPVRIG